MIRYAVIMAGGSGERFWPLSRRTRPKQLLKLTDPDLTMIEEAVERIEPLVGRDRVILATATHLEGPLREPQVVPDANVIAEPDKRNTLGCLVWVAAALRGLHPDEDVSMAILTADHKIGEAHAFRDTVRSGLELAEQHGKLVTIGIRPDRPETGYGYIELGDGRVGEGFEVASFREKPDKAAAQNFVESGRFLWNSGMFFWTLATFESELREVQPEAYANYRRILKRDDPIGAFRALPNLSIDFALMERSRNVAVVPSRFPWDDVGAWDALDRTLQPNHHGNVSQGDGIDLGSRNCIVVRDEGAPMVATIGLEDIVVVATRDAVLVCKKSEVQRVKEVVARLPEGLR